MTAAQKATTEAARLLPWRHNGLRHAFCSYRVAASQDVPRTALEAGNSVSMIFAHHRALATESEGKAWFFREEKAPVGALTIHAGKTRCPAHATLGVHHVPERSLQDWFSLNHTRH